MKFRHCIDKNQRQSVVRFVSQIVGAKLFDLRPTALLLNNKVSVTAATVLFSGLNYEAY